jgi:butyrate kinase
MKRTPGTFYNHSNQTEYIALSRVAEAVGVPAYIITNAISDGSLPVQEISGCKCVAVADLFRFKDEGGAV